VDVEEKLRREAVRRVLAGESASAVARELRRSRRWVVKWLARYDPKDDGWARERSRAPRHSANRSAPKLEALILAVRRRLQANPWAQVGATAILWELSKLRLRELPEPRTIERILARAGVPRRARRERYRPKGTPYPAPPALRPNDCQEADLIGPRHLSGAIPFFVLNVVDLGRHAVACELLASKADRATAEGLLRAWSRLGIPRRLKLDNWLIAGASTTRLPLTVQLCVALGVTVTFIPFAEPWRNGVVEQFNDTFDKRFSGPSGSATSGTCCGGWPASSGSTTPSTAMPRTGARPLTRSLGEPGSSRAWLIRRSGSPRACRDGGGSSSSG